MSPKGARVTLVPGKDGLQRFCITFHNSNAVTIFDSFPFLHINDLLQKVGQAKIFSKMDRQSGFYQVSIREAFD